jgi:hypothetical protein
LDYQVKFVVHSGSGTDSGQDVFLNGLSQSWPNDIRFADGNYYLLSYWVESSDANSALVWVKVPSIPASPGSATVYLYYGKNYDVGASSGAAASPFFDDFSVVDRGKWDVYGSVSASDGVVTVTGGVNPFGDMQGRSSFGVNYAVRSRAKLWTAQASGPNTQVGFYNVADSNKYEVFYTADGLGYQGLRMQQSNGSGAIALIAQWTTGWRVFEVERNANTNRVYKIDDGTTATGAISNYLPVTAMYPRLLSALRGYDLQADWPLVRKYTYNEPQHSTWNS